VFRFPELASTQPELLSTLVRKLHAEGALGCMRDTSDEMEEIREALRDSQRGSRNEAIRNRYHGAEGRASSPQSTRTFAARTSRPLS